MNSNEIRDIMQCLNINEFAGVVPSNKLPIMRLGDKEFYIVNLDTSDSPGSHWVGLFIKGDEAAYFDPLALPFTNKLIIQSLKAYKIENIIYNTKQIQSFSSESCAKFVILFGVCVVKLKFSFTSFLDLFYCQRIRDNEIYINKVL